MSMRILLTGYPGFLSGAVLEYFSARGAVVDTLGLTTVERKEPAKHIVCNLAEQIPELAGCHYDMVIHAAGKAHVIPRTEQEKQQFFEVNVKGTEHLLMALQAAPPRALLFISSVAVYGLEAGEHIPETAPLLANTPYGRSKIQAEQLIRETAFASPVVRGIVRLPLIAGPDAPGNLGSMFRAMKKGVYFNIGNGEARRSAILLCDVAPFLEELAVSGGTYNLTDGHDLSFSELYSGLCRLNRFPHRPKLPVWCAVLLAYAGELIQGVTHKTFIFNKKRLHQMTQTLTFDGSAAQRDFSWRPHPVTEHLRELSSRN